MQKALTAISKLSIYSGIALMVIPVLILMAINTPDIWYRINPDAVQAEVRALTRDPFADTFGSIQLIPKAFALEAAPDASLPSGHYLSIPKIGVSTEIREGSNEQEQEVLAKGVWRMPGFGTPLQNDEPMILAAHRWGSTDISADYRQQHMFINIPQLAPGDTISVTWDQKVYTYRVRESEENTYVSDLADLILITCKYLDSPYRIIVYADRIS